MEYNLEPVIKAINEVNDNIWLGDFKKAREIANSNLKTIRKQLRISELQETATKLKAILQEIRKTAREEEVEKRRLWVAEEIFKIMKEKELNPIENFYGVLTMHLADLMETVGYLIEAKSQATLEGLPEKGLEEDRFLRITETYRYAIQRLPDRWEVRAILDTPASSWNLKSLKDQLSEHRVLVEETAKTRLSKTFQLYSQDMYVQAVGLGNQAEFSLYTPATADAKRKVRKIIEIIIRTLTE